MICCNHEVWKPLRVLSQVGLAQINLCFVLPLWVAVISVQLAGVDKSLLYLRLNPPNPSHPMQEFISAEPERVLLASTQVFAR